MHAGILCFLTCAELALGITARVLMLQPPWIRPDAMPEILFRPEDMPRIERVCCPTDAIHANVTWWKGSQLVALGAELVFRPLELGHVGEYHCEAENKAGRSMSSQLAVKRAFLNVTAPIAQRLFLMEGQAASIPCAAPNGYPVPVAFWSSTKHKQPPRMVVDPQQTLHLQNVVPQDHGTVLQCSVKHLTRTYIIKSVQLTVYPRPIECFEQPRLMYATESIVLKKYTDASVYCVTSGPSSTILWTLPTGAKAAVSETPSDHLRINSSTLAIDEPAFRILCNNSGLASEITVTLASAPVVHPMSNVSKIEGEKVILQCHVSGKPKPRIEWLFNRQPVDKKKIIDNNIVVPSVTFADMGVYRCDAVNLYGRSHREVTLSVDSARPHITAETKCFDAVVGDRVLVPCEAKGFRAPHKTWLKNGVEIESSSDEDLLELLDVRPADKGHYACRVCEKLDKLNCAVYKFQVRVFPSDLVETPPKSIVVSENEPLNVSCIPRFVDDDVIVWRFNGTYQSQGQTFQSAKALAGTYTCELQRNKTLVKHWNVRVSVRTRPAKPNITEILCDSGFALLKWEPATADAAFYEILHLQDSQRWITVGFVANGTSFQAELTHCTSCRYRVSAYNEAGSTTSEVEQCTAPVRASHVVLISGLTVARKQNAFRVSWTSTKQTNRTCFRVCSHPSAACYETDETYHSFGLSSALFTSFFTVSACNATNTIHASGGFSATPKAYYNCNLTLEITAIRHLRIDSIKILWEFAADQDCSLSGRLVVDDSISYRVDLRAKEFALEGFEPTRMYCVKLKAFHGDQELHGSSNCCSCFQPGQAWRSLEIEPHAERRGGRVQIRTPENTTLYYSPIGEHERWISTDSSSVDIAKMGGISLKLVQKLDGECRVSKVVFVKEPNVIDWILWLCGAAIIVGGVFFTVTVFLRKKSYKADLY